MACGHGGGKEWPGDVEVVENGQGMWRRSGMVWGCGGAQEWSGDAL